MTGVNRIIHKGIGWDDVSGLMFPVIKSSHLSRPSYGRITFVNNSILDAVGPDIISGVINHWDILSTLTVLDFETDPPPCPVLQIKSYYPDSYSSSICSNIRSSNGTERFWRNVFTRYIINILLNTLKTHRCISTANI